MSPDSNLKQSLYYPYGYLTTTHCCFFTYENGSWEKKIKNKCDRLCCGKKSKLLYPTYVLIDVNNIQGYVFASDKLKQICNASILLSEEIEDKKIPTVAKEVAELIRCSGGTSLFF
ncbi:hypothetical protein HZA55_08950 [Candidatus Poribacteria bacterium]|nr:hypothetical protein [Candidatus Poribacteria bacterium]